MENGNEPFTINSVIYRNIADTLNKTCFEVYVTEAYRPIIHSYYLDHPEIPPINTPEPWEEGNFCKASLPIVNIIDLIATGQSFRFKYSSDIPKVERYLKGYLDMFEGISVAHDPQQAAFLEKVKHVYDDFKARHQKQEDRKPQEKPHLSLIERIRIMTMGI